MSNVYYTTVSLIGDIHQPLHVAMHADNAGASAFARPLGIMGKNTTAV
jgi:hypothetical protein